MTSAKNRRNTPATPAAPAAPAAPAGTDGLTQPQPAQAAEAAAQAAEAAASVAAEAAEAAMSVAINLTRVRALKAAAQAAKPARGARGARGAAKEAAERPRPQWPQATVEAAAAIGLELPNTYPSKGLATEGAAMPHKGQCWVGSPYLEDLDGPACPTDRADRGLSAIRMALKNRIGDQPILPGVAAAVDGGICSWDLLFAMLADENLNGLKWATRFSGSGQTNILRKVAVVAGRYAIATTEGIRLIRDFYPKANTQTAIIAKPEPKIRAIKKA